jgi:hypothetical protein
MTKRDELERGLHRLGTDVVLGTRPCSRLVDGLAREDSERDRDRQRRRQLGEGPRDGMSENVEVRGLAADQAAKRHDSIEPSGPREQPDRRRKLEGAGYLEFLDLRVLGERGLEGAPGQRPGDLVVPARSDDGHAGAAVRILHPCRSLPRGRHMPQSSPRMHSRLVAG